MTNTILLKTIALSLLLVLTAFIDIKAGFAANNSEETLYDVEIIIFSQKEKIARENEETWPEDLTYPRFSRSREIFSPYEYLMQKDEVKETLFVTEPMDEVADDLSSYAKKLDNDKFELLMYKKWRQPLEKSTKTKSIFVTDRNKDYLFQSYSPSSDTGAENAVENGEASAEQQLLSQLLAEEKLLNQPVQEQPDFISDLDPIEPYTGRDQVSATEDTFGPPNHKVYGLFKVFKSRHPHLSFNVFYKGEELADDEAKEKTELFPMENKPEEIVNTETTSIEAIEQEILEQNKSPISALQLNISSRIRLNELHYFDHPKFGVIARVRKYEPPVVEDSSKN